LVIYYIKNEKKRGLSQNTVAEKVGIKGASISNFEKNIYKPRDVTLQKLADLYEIDFLTLKKINDKTKRHNPRDIGKDLIGAVIDEWYERWLSKLIVDITKPNYLILAKEDLKIIYE